MSVAAIGFLFHSALAAPLTPPSKNKDGAITSVELKEEGNAFFVKKDFMCSPTKEYTQAIATALSCTLIDLRVCA